MMAATNKPNLVWSVTLDNRYIVAVERTANYTADLVIMDGDKELLREGVNLAYGAAFGPDVDDVATWQNRAIDFVDNLGK